MASSLHVLSPCIQTRQRRRPYSGQQFDLWYGDRCRETPVFSQFTLTEEQQNNFERVLQEFGKYFVPKRKVIHKRATFHRKSQRERESIEEYIWSLYELSEYAEFAEKETTICDRLVLGMVRQHELVVMQMRKQWTLLHTFSDTGHLVVVGVVPDTLEVGENSIRTGPLMQAQVLTVTARRATVCKQGNCPARGKKCQKCQKMSHFACCCWSTHAVNKVHVRQSESYAEEPRAEQSTIFLEQ